MREGYCSDSSTRLIYLPNSYLQLPICLLKRVTISFWSFLSVLTASSASLSFCSDILFAMTSL